MNDEIKEIISLVEKTGYLREITRYVNLADLNYRGEVFAMDSFSLGTTDPSAPTFFLVGGVHGLERIGAELCLSLLRSTIKRLVWDNAFRQLLESVRIVFVPLVNPVGYYHYTRCNGNGVDLMRNGLVDAEDKVPYLLGGHRISPKLPWYRGQVGIMELENKALVEKFFTECSQSKCVVSLDFHSGFGFKDRLWFPYSKTKKPFEHLAEMHAFSDLLEHSYPYHIYRIEPQSHGYLLNGDIWDYIYQEFIKINTNSYLPMTLEMGSWLWVKKNPLQLISKHGLFNPIKAHRIKRIYRRHHILYDFVLKALYSHSIWSELDLKLRHKHFQMAMDSWYS
jgi:hypothetical protein